MRKPMVGIDAKIVTATVENDAKIDVTYVENDAEITVLYVKNDANPLTRQEKYDMLLKELMQRMIGIPKAA